MPDEVVASRRYHLVGPIVCHFVSAVWPISYSVTVITRPKELL